MVPEQTSPEAFLFPKKKKRIQTLLSAAIEFLPMFRDQLLSALLDLLLQHHRVHRFSYQRQIPLAIDLRPKINIIKNRF